MFFKKKYCKNILFFKKVCQKLELFLQYFFKKYIYKKVYKKMSTLSESSEHSQTDSKIQDESNEDSIADLQIQQESPQENLTHSQKQSLQKLLYEQEQRIEFLEEKVFIFHDKCKKHIQELVDYLEFLEKKIDSLEEKKDSCEKCRKRHKKRHHDKYY
jgi:hypothetical protein